MSQHPHAPGRSPAAILFVALALSIGWGVRGNWGHEFGAMIPGALAAMAAVLASGRDDWYRRVPFFAFFGAVGWSFGGSMSYMQVIAYTHSGHALSVAYGLACLFLMGFIWGALGGTGTSLPAFLSRARLTELLIPALSVFAVWFAQDVFLSVWEAGLADRVKQGAITAEQMNPKRNGSIGTTPTGWASSWPPRRYWCLAWYGDVSAGARGWDWPCVPAGGSASPCSRSDSACG